VTGGATERLGRLLALVPYLLARPGAKVSDVAVAFSVSERTLIDDLRLLFVCGLPGHLPDDLIDASFEGGVIHLGNADTIARPLRLGSDEAVALLVGLRALSEVPGLEDRDALERAIAKLERAAGDAASVSRQVSVEMATESTTLPLLRQAVTGRRRIHLTYYVPGRDETTERDVDPMRLLLVDGHTYLEGWCRRADSVRLFRADRILDAMVLDIAADVPSRAVARDLGDGLFTPSPSDTPVTIEVTAAGRWIIDYYPCESVTELPHGRTLVRLRVTDTRWVIRLVLRLGSSGRFVDPPELAGRVMEIAQRTLTSYEIAGIGPTVKVEPRDAEPLVGE
jgi:proteasome accessory factor C